MYARRLDSCVSAISLSLHRHPFVCILCISPFTCYNNKNFAPLAFGSSNRTMCVIAPQKCAGVHGRTQKLCCFMTMLSMEPYIENGTLSLRKRASGTVKVFSWFLYSSAGFRDWSGQEPRQMHTVVQKIGRLVLPMFYRALPGGIRPYAFFKVHMYSFCRVWAGSGGLGASLRSLMIPQLCTTPSFVLVALSYYLFCASSTVLLPRET